MNRQDIGDLTSEREITQDCFTAKRRYYFDPGSFPRCRHGLKYRDVFSKNVHAVLCRCSIAERFSAVRLLLPPTRRNRLCGGCLLNSKNLWMPFAPA